MAYSCILGRKWTSDAQFENPEHNSNICSCAGNTCTDFFWNCLLNYGNTPTHPPPPPSGFGEHHAVMDLVLPTNHTISANYASTML